MRSRFPARPDIVCAAVLIAVCFGLWLPRLRGPIDVRWDAAAYYELGTSLATGKGYRLLHEPGQIRATLYPPMLPALIAVHQLAAGTSDVAVVGPWLRRSYMALFFAFALAVYVLMRRFLQPVPAVIGSLLVVLHLQLVFLSDLAYPELPYALTTVLFALSLTARQSRKTSWAAAMLVVVAFSIRTVGVAALAAWVSQSAFRRSFRQALIRIGVSLTLVSAWAGYITWVESQTEYRSPAYTYQRADYAYINVSYHRNLRYVDPFQPELGDAGVQEKVTRLARNIARLPVTVGEAVSTQRGFLRVLRDATNERLPWPAVPQQFDVLVIGAAALLVGLGAILHLRRGQPVLLLYVLLTLLLIYLTPWPVQFDRYVSPLSPFLVLFLMTGVTTCTSALPRSRRAVRVSIAATMNALVIVLVLAQVGTLALLFGRLHTDATWPRPVNTPIQYRLFFHEGTSRATDAALDWLQSYAARDRIVAATVPSYAYLRTGLTSVLPPLEVDARLAQRLLDTVPVSLMIVDHDYFRPYTSGVIAIAPTEWRRVYGEVSARESEGLVEIYERVPQPHRGDAGIR